MQKINSSSSKKKIVAIIIGIITIVAVAGAVGYFLLQKSSQDSSVSKPNNTVDYNPPTDEQKKAGEDAKKDFIEKTDEVSPNPSTQPSGTSSVSLSSVGQNGQTLSIRTVISAQSAGSCKLILSMPGQTDIVRTADTQDMGSYITCKGFDVDTTSLTKGTWKVSIQFSGDATGLVATATTEVR